MPKTEAVSWPLEEDRQDTTDPPQRHRLHVTEVPCDEEAKPVRLWARLTGLVFSTHFLALADQAVMSGTSLLSAVLVGRCTVPSELGIFTIGLSVLGSALAVQDALILLPYTIQRHHPSRTANEHAGMSLLHTGILSAVVTVVLAVGAAGMLAFGADSKLTWLAWALVFTVPFALQREFSRSYAFAHLDVASAFAVDAAVATLQLGMLGWLGWTGRMSAFGACAALGIACAVSSLIWLYRARSNFEIKTNQVWQATRQSWVLGKWLCAGQLTVSIQGYASYWMLPPLLGMTETGVYAACNTIASLANPLLSAFRNTLTPRAVLAFKEGGGTSLRRQAMRDAVMLSGAMFVFCVVVFFSGDLLVRIIYHEPEYGGRGDVISILAFAVMATAVGAPASNAMASMERPQAIVYATSVGTVVTLAAICLLSVPWGLAGAAYGVLAGSIAGAMARWVAFLAVLARLDNGDGGRHSVLEVLKQLRQDSADADWDIRPLGKGFQGQLYVVEAKGDRALWQGHRHLVVKLYPDQGEGARTAQRQFDAQVGLHVDVNGTTVDGWKTHTPEPLYVSTSPPALVMTMAAGTDLNKCLAAGDEPRPGMLESLVRAVVSVMRPYWTAGGAHGDLCLQNILCEPADRIVSLIDADRPAALRTDVPSASYPASFDLAGIICDVATDIRTFDRRVMARKQMFAENILLAFLGTMDTPEEQRQLIEEVGAVARAQLEALDLSWSPQGLYHLLQRYVAKPRIDRLLADTLHRTSYGSRFFVDGGEA